MNPLQNSNNLDIESIKSKKAITQIIKYLK